MYVRIPTRVQENRKMYNFTRSCRYILFVQYYKYYCYELRLNDYETVHETLKTRRVTVIINATMRCIPIGSRQGINRK